MAYFHYLRPDLSTNSKSAQVDATWEPVWDTLGQKSGRWHPGFHSRDTSQVQNIDFLKFHEIAIMQYYDHIRFSKMFWGGPD